ncbi:MAG TPA: glycosyltransferase [Woeseiaceae bacterium]|nr:glycosyltransferase [Woeseiaceae bacterium]
MQRGDVEILELRKPGGKHPPTYWRIFTELRRLRPDIVHTRNLGTLDLAWIARVAGCPIRIHGEHGWSADDPDGSSVKYRFLRKICDPAIDRYVAVSENITHWLVDEIGIPKHRVTTLHNGVDSERFRKTDSGAAGASVDSPIVIGTVGRQEPIKGLEVLLMALRDLLVLRPELRSRLQVLMGGDGPSHQNCLDLRDRFGLNDIVEFPGRVIDVPAYLRQLTIFIQPSLNEGISNTVLEAMASGLPIIATNVGGNPELIRDGKDGRLVPPNDTSALRMAIEKYLDDAAARERDGTEARARVERCFSLDTMVGKYAQLYNDAVAEATRRAN